MWRATSISFAGCGVRATQMRSASLIFTVDEVLADKNSCACVAGLK